MSDEQRDLRAARRAFIREHHPDAGGDPVLFVAGLRRFDEAPAVRSRPMPSAATVPRYRVRRSRRPDRVLLRAVRRALDRRAGRPRRNLQ